MREDKTYRYYEEVQKRFPAVQVVVWDGPFNYSAINNFGAKYADGDFLLLLNNDTEVITPDWLESMMGYCQREDVGIVGAKLLYPDNTVQHAGVVVGIAGFAGHILTGYDQNAPGYLWRLQTAQDESAVTGACLMVKRSVFDALQGLDESFAVALNDIVFACVQETLENWWYLRRKQGFIIMNQNQEVWKIQMQKKPVFRRKWIISGNAMGSF